METNKNSTLIRRMSAERLCWTRFYKKAIIGSHAFYSNQIQVGAKRLPFLLMVSGCERLNSDTHTHTHLYDPEWHISPDRWHHTLPWLVGTSPFNLNIQLLRNLSLSLSLTPYGQSQGALFWDRWPMATTLTQSRVKPRNKTGRLVWFGPIRAFRVRRKCKEENERGYGLGKVKKNISHWTSPRQVIYVQFCTTAFHLYTKLNVHILWLWINVFCNFKHYFFFKKDLTVLKNEAQCCPLSQQTFRPCSDPQKFSSKSSSDKLYSISKQKSS